MPLLALALALVVAGQQTAPASEARAAEAYIQVRLDADHGPSFEQWAGLVDFIKDAARHARGFDARARFVLYELRATSRALEMARLGDSPAPAAFLRERKAILVHHEPAGQYVFRNDYLLGLHDRFKGRPIAGEIAWFAAENGLPGECEGYTPCHVFRVNALDGEYLRRHPGGKHATKSMDRIVEFFDYKGRGPIAMTTWAEECKEMKESLERLVAAVQGSPVTGRNAALRALRPVQTVCR